MKFSPKLLLFITIFPHFPLQKCLVAFYPPVDIQKDMENMENP